MTERIQLPVIDTQQQRAGTEEIEAEALGNKRYRLIHSPGYVEGLAADDEIEIVDEHVGFRVLKRSGNLCVWMIFASDRDLFGASALTLRDRVEQMGGRLDGGTARTLIFTIPVRAGWPTIEQVFNDAVAASTGSTWFYGNVYDPRSGEPLNWWR